MRKLIASAGAKREALVAFALSLGIVLLLQVLGGAYQSGFGGHPDEAAHLTTALMVRDFLAALDFRHPWQFATQYYLHYPKVAIGHWPPLLYAAAGVWFLLCGASRATSLLFIAVTAAATAGLIYWTGKRLIGRWAGGLAALLFLASPLVQESSARFMTEHPVTLAMLAATLCLVRFTRTGGLADGMGFGILAAVAILTRGSGWALALVPGLTILLTRRWNLLRRSGLWLATVPVLVTCVPWYIATRGMVEGSWTGSGDGPPFWLSALSGFSRFLYLGLGFAVLLLAVAGLYAKVVRPWRSRAVLPEWAALTALAASTFALQCAVPASIESRFMVTLIPSVVLFTAAGVAEIAVWLRPFIPRDAASAIVALAVLFAFLLQSFALPARLRNSGYEAIASRVSALTGHTPQVWLIASGSVGEGSLIAAVALDDEKRPSSVILRGSKILVKEDWLGRGSQDLFQTPEALTTLLDEIPVGIIVLDDHVPPDEHRAYHDRLRALVTNDTSHWAPIGSFGLVRGNSVYTDAVHVYARRPVKMLARSSTPPDLRRVGTLIGRDGTH